MKHLEYSIIYDIVRKFFLAYSFCSILLCISGCSDSIDPASSQTKPDNFNLHLFIKRNVPDKLKAPDVQAIIKHEIQIRSQMETAGDRSDLHSKIGFSYLDLSHFIIDKNVNKVLEEISNKEFEYALNMDKANLNAFLGLNIHENNLRPKNIIKIYSIIEKRFKNKYTMIEDGNEDNQTKIKYEKIAFLFKKTGSVAGLWKAVEITEEVIKRYPGDQKNIVEMAKLYMSLRELDKAEFFARKAIEIAEGSRNSFDVNVGKNILGYVYLHRGEYEQAEKLFKEARLSENGEPWACAFQSLGVLYSETGKPKLEAENQMKVADLYNKTGIWGYHAALSNIKAGDYTNALKYINHAIKIESNELFPIVKGHIFLALREYLKAQKLFNKVLIKNPSSPGAKVGLGHLCIIRKDFDCALSNFKPALNSEDNIDTFIFEMVHLGMGWMYANQNQHEKALKHYDKILNQKPNSILTLISKGNSLIGLFRMEEAESALTKALELQPGNPYATAELAVIQMSQGKVEEAKTAFQNAIIQDDSNYTCPYEGLGLLYLQQGELQKAKVNLEKAIQINPEIEYKKFNGLAKIYIKEGRLDKARELLRKSIDNFPYDGEAKKLLVEVNLKKAKNAELIQ